MSVLRGPLLAAGGLAVLSLAVYAAGEVASFLAAVTVAILAVDAVVAVAAVRLVRYGGWRKPAQVAKRPDFMPANIPAARAALPAPPLAIGQARPVLDGAVVAEADKVRP